MRAKKQQLEMKSRGSGGIEEEIAALEMNVVNVRDVILRQRSIKGFVIAPKQLYLNKLKEIDEIKRQLQLVE